MPRYINADLLLLQEPEVRADYGPEYGCEWGYSRDQIMNFPTVSPEEIRGVGYWSEESTGDGLYDYRFRCSYCHCATPNKAYVIAPDFCPTCGAVMKGANDGSTHTL